MSRSDGTFPPYYRVDLDPNVWPQKYWDSARRCLGCELRWPNTLSFELCPHCGAGTEVSQSPPDMRWPEAIRELLKFRFETWYEAYNDGLTDEQIVWEDVKTNGEIDDQKIKRAVEEFITKEVGRTIS